MDTLFPLRPFDFFSNRNTYTGSAGQLRYLIKPVQETLEVQVWNQDVCFELAQILDCASFPLSPGGLAEIRAWLDGNIAALGHNDFFSFTFRPDAVRLFYPPVEEHMFLVEFYYIPYF